MGRICVYLLLLVYPLLAFAEDAPVVLSLDEAIKLALQQNRTLQSARDRISSANISLESAQSEFAVKIRPEVSGFLQNDQEVSQGYGLRVSKKFHIGGELSWQVQTQIDKSLTKQYQTEVTVAYTQPLLKGRGTLPTTAELVTAERGTRSQYRSLVLAQQQLIISVAAAYYGILRDQMMVDVNAQTLARAKTLLQAAEAKLQVGMASKMDVFRAELQALTAENGVVDAQAALQNTKRQFNVLLGMAFETEFTLSSTLDYQPVTVDQEQLIQQALANRLEIQEAYENLNDAERQVQLARQNLSPPLDVSIRYTFNGAGNGFKESLDLNENRWGIGVNSAFNLDTARDSATYQQAQLAYNSALRAIQASEQDVTLDVLQTVTNVNQAQARVTLQEQSVRQAEKQWELADLRYKKGLSDNLDVIDAEGTLLTARTNYYAAIAQHLIAQLKLKQVAGTLETP